MNICLVRSAHGWLRSLFCESTLVEREVSVERTRMGLAKKALKGESTGGGLPTLQEGL